MNYLRSFLLPPAALPSLHCGSIFAQSQAEPVTIDALASAHPLPHFSLKAVNPRLRVGVCICCPRLVE